MEAGGIEIQIHLQLHSKFKCHLDYLRHSLKKQNQLNQENHNNPKPVKCLCSASVCFSPYTQQRETDTQTWKAEAPTSLQIHPSPNSPQRQILKPSKIKFKEITFRELLSGQGCCCQPSSSPWNLPHAGKWKLTPDSCPLTSTCVCAHIHAQSV